MNCPVKPARTVMEPLEPRCLLSGGVIDVTQGLPDLAIEFAPNLTLPANYLSGGGATISVPLVIRNVDTAGDGQVALAVARNATATVRLYARPAEAQDDTQDIEVGEVSGVKVGGLAVGAARNVRAKITLPSEVVDGNHVLVAVVDAQGEVLELNEVVDDQDPQANNVAVSSEFTVTQGRPDLIVEVISTDIPDDLTSSDGTTYRITYRVTNQGTLAIDKDAVVSLSVLQELLDQSESQELGDWSVAVGGLKPGKSVTGSGVLQITNEVDGPDGEAFSLVTQQQLVLTIDAGESVDELDEENNTATLGPVNVTMGGPYFVSQLSKVKLPKRVQGITEFSVPVQITNVGTGAFGFQQTRPAYVTIVARPTDDPSGDSDIVISEEIEVSVPLLLPNRSETITIDAVTPYDLPADEYQIVSVVRMAGATSDEDQFEYSEPSAKRFTAIEAIYGLSVELGNARLPDELVSGDGSVFKFPIILRNTGNVKLPDDLSVLVQLLALPASLANSPDLAAGLTDGEHFDVSGLAPGKTRKGVYPAGFAAEVGAAPGVEPQFLLFAKFPGDIATAYLLNTDPSDTVSLDLFQGGVDLTVSVGDNVALDAQALSGDGTRHRLPIVVGNEGTLPIGENTSVSATVIATPHGGGDAVELGTIEGLDISRLAPGREQRFTLDFSLPTELADGLYDISVLIDSDGAVPEFDETNNDPDPDAALPQMAVTQGLVDLAVTQVTSRLDNTQALSGDGVARSITFTLSNGGTIDTAADQLVDFTIVAVDTSDDSESTVATIEDVNIGALRQGTSRQVKLDFTLPQSLLSGEYQLKVVADSADEVLEPEGDENNTALGPTIQVTRGGVDLAIAFHESLDLPDTATAGDGQTIYVPITLTNLGTLPLGTDQTVTITIKAHKQSAGDDTSGDELLLELTAQSLGNLGVGGSKLLRLAVQLPGSLTPGSYVLTATVESDTDVLDLDPGNDTIATGPLTEVA